MGSPGRSEKLMFPGASGELLAARLEQPTRAPSAYALFAHCFTCSKDIFAARRISQALAERGIAVLRFDFTGLGSSEGDFANTNFSSNVEDLLAAADYMRAHFEAPQLLVGHSLGGAAVLAAAGEITEARAVVTIGAPSEPAHVAQLLADKGAEIEKEGEANVELAGRTFRIKKQFLDDISEANLRARIPQMKKALLVCHSPTDDIVGIDNATKIFVAAKHPKSFVSLDGADHLVSQRADADYLADVLASWANRYLEQPNTGQAEAESDAAPHGEVTVTETGEGRFTQSVRAGRHTVTADEPPSVGGLDLGPTPYDFLLAALGTCTSMTIRMYADRKGWPVEKVRVKLRHEHVHAKQCEECESTHGKVDRIDRDILIEGPLDEEQYQRLLEIADKCPVHRSLHTETVVRSKLER